MSASDNILKPNFDAPLNVKPPPAPDPKNDADLIGTLVSQLNTATRVNDKLIEELAEARAKADAGAAPEFPPLEAYTDEKSPDTIEPFPSAALDEISDEVRPQVVQNLLEAKSVAVIVGAPNTGKTFFGIDACVHVAAGEPWFGAKVSGGAVLYIAAEAPGSVKTRARLAAERAFPGKRLAFHVVSIAPGLGSEIESVHDTKRILATVRTVEAREGLDVKVIAIDTVASVLGDGEENADGMLRLAASAKFIAAETSAVVVLIHHPSKGDPNSLRGHSSLAAAVDTIILITTDENTGIRTATLTKSRDSAAGRQIFFNLEAVALPTLDSFGDPRSSCIVVPVSNSASPRRPGGKVQEQILSELERRFRTGETHWDEGTVRNAAHMLNVHRNTVPKALKALRTSGFIIGESSRMTLKFPSESK